MRVKNISKKIIGNSQFRLLPGDSMTVTGREAWVRDYLAEKSVEEVPENNDSARESAGPATDTSETARSRSGKKPADKA